MADEKQLTVAELLARNAKDTKAPARGTRRRRRSLDEGGISVAELTGNVDKVTAAPAEAKHSSVSIDETAPVIPAPKKAEEPEAKAEGKAEPKAEPKAETKAEPKTETKPEAARSSQPSTDDTHVIKRVTDAEVAAKPAATVAPEKADKPEGLDLDAPRGARGGDVELETLDGHEDVEDHHGYGRDVVDEDEGDEDEGKVNAFAVVLFAVIGVVLGAVVFKGFEVLWERFDRLIVAILGVVVTGVIIGLVHALRTHRDGFSMFLAAIVGLILTFGPLLIVM